MEVKGITRIFCLMASVALMRAYPLGAPPQTCDTMMPLHYETPLNPVTPLHQPQEGAPFFSIHVSKTKDVMPGESIEVTITADQEYFEGFLIQARPIDEPGFRVVKYGTWSPISTTAQPLCDNAAMTHNVHIHYDNVTMRWTAPDSPIQNFQFKATIVKGYSTFFTNVVSETINYEFDNGVYNNQATLISPSFWTFFLLLIGCSFLRYKH